MSNFFEEMSGFSVFESLSNSDLYQQPPTDWWVVITDVKGSTKAIEEGRYKDVNTVGVASIVAIKNAMKDEVFPFVFGGDGATALIPSAKKTAVEKELGSLKTISAEKFQLSLRVGVVSIAELLEQHAIVEVAKYLLPSQTPIAIFRGGGLTKAEQLIKGAQDKYEVPSSTEWETDLKTLSCRWEPIRSKKGQILSLLVCAQSEENEVAHTTYDQFLEHLLAILSQEQDSFHPVKIENMRYRKMGALVKNDLRYQKTWWRRLLRMIDTIGASFLFRFGLFRRMRMMQNYNHALAAHSDYRKFDDVLRMVLDCSAEQIDAIQAICLQFYEEKRIFYGIHLSDTALMTCQFSGFQDGNHLHFIDGGDGGYAMAAKQLKQQLKSNK